MRRLLAEFPAMPASVIAERVGWRGRCRGSARRSRCCGWSTRRKIRPTGSATGPGDQAQCDLWFPPARVPLGAGQSGSPPVLVMVASFSRFITGRMLPTRATPDLLAGMWSLLAGQLGAVPRRLVWDNEAGIGRGGRLAGGVAAFTGTLATQARAAADRMTRNPKASSSGPTAIWRPRSCPAGCSPRPADFNAQLAGWLPRANARRVRSLGARPADLIGRTARR